MEIIEVPMTDMAHEMSVKNDTAFDVRIIVVGDHQHADLSVGIQQIGHPYNPLNDLSFLQTTSLRASFYIYGLKYLCGTVSGTFQFGVKADSVTTYSIGGMIAVPQILNGLAKVFRWLDIIVWRRCDSCSRKAA